LASAGLHAIRFRTVGVGSILATTLSGGVFLDCSDALPLFFESCAVGVGSENPHPLSDVRRTAVGCGYNVPRCIKPEVGKRSKYAVESSKSERWAVFHEDVIGFHFANDAMHLPPESASVSIKAGSFPCKAEILTGESSCHDIHALSPLRSIKRPHIVKDREFWQHPVKLPLTKHLLAMLVDLDGSNRRVAEQQAAEDPATGSGK
jgi:hypothetical protein